MKKKQKKKSKYDIYDDKEDAYLEGYSDATDDKKIKIRHLR